MARPSSFDRGEALAKARDLFWRKGFHATSLRDLEAVLKLKPGSIYAAFGNKEALYRECLDLYMHDSAIAFEATLVSHPSPLTALAAYLRSFVDARGEAPSSACMVVKTLLEMSRGGPEALAQAAAAHFEGMADVFAKVFERAKALGEVSPDLDTRRTALKLQASLTGLRAMADSMSAKDELVALAEDLAADIEALRKC